MRAQVWKKFSTIRFLGSTTQRTACLTAALATSIASASAWADDIDVFSATINAQQKPNILFVLDYSTSMQWDTSGVSWSTGNGPSRISILKSAMEKILKDNVGQINAGLGSLYSTSTTGIRWPISDLAADASSIDPNIPANTYTVGDIIKQRINERDADGSTATVDALVEAAQYFRGDPVTHNDARVSSSRRHRPATWNNALRRYTGGNADASLSTTYSPSNAWSSNTRQTFYCNDYSESGGPDFCQLNNTSSCTSVSADDATTPGYELKNNLWGDYKRCKYRRNKRWETPRFNSPLTDSCEGQTNAIVLITDGVPSARKNGASLRSVLPNQDVSACQDLSGLFRNFSYTGNNANCAIEIVRSLANETVTTDAPNSRVKTYTVGFNIAGAGQKYLDLISDAGNGKSYSAQTPAQLTDAIANVLDDVKTDSQSFSALSVDIDKPSFAHSNRVFYSLFSPSKRRSWNGNLKGYFIEPEGLIDIKGARATNGNNVFTDEAQSFWSPQADGNKVNKGGASEKLLTATRTLYTYVGDELSNGPVALAGRDDTRLHRSNDEITNDMLGLLSSASDTAQRNAALDWIQNAPMGDPLHTKSVGVNYGNRHVVYTMTNQGLLHAFNATSPTSKASGGATADITGGDELFAFMPQRLLKNLPDLLVNNVGVGHIYGLDGGMTRWHDDTDNNGIVNNNENVTLYFGMRRGGSAYYALDVSNPDAPELKWMIDDTTAGFEKLAQSWSRMSLIQVAQGDTKRKVLAFAGGYDAQLQDDIDSPVESRGNAIYIVDENGRLLRTIDNSDHPDMKYSIASDLTVIDSNNDNIADRLYVGDLGGQLWRVDFPDISENPVVTKLASLGDQYHQPFFYPPSVSLNGESGNRHLSITIGSGNRTNPLLENVTNNFYMIRDNDVGIGAPKDSPYPTATISDLHDATENDIQSGVSSVAQGAEAELETKRGWRVKLEPGEKSLSSILTFEGRVMATTYKPSAADSETTCGVQPTGRYYTMNVRDAGVPRSVVDDYPHSGDSGEATSVTKADRSNPINSAGILSGPVIVLSSGNDEGMEIAGNEVETTFKRTLQRVFWHAR